MATPAADKPLPGRRPSSQSTAEITGLKWPPETGPNIKINTASPKTVAVLFSSSCKPHRTATAGCGDTGPDHHRHQQGGTEQLGRQRPLRCDRAGLDA